MTKQCNNSDDAGCLYCGNGQDHDTAADSDWKLLRKSRTKENKQIRDYYNGNMWAKNCFRKHNNNDNCTYCNKYQFGAAHDMTCNCTWCTNLYSHVEHKQIHKNIPAIKEDFTCKRIDKNYKCDKKDPGCPYCILGDTDHAKKVHEKWTQWNTDSYKKTDDTKELWDYYQNSMFQNNCDKHNCTYCEQWIVSKTHKIECDCELCTTLYSHDSHKTTHPKILAMKNKFGCTEMTTHYNRNKNNMKNASEQKVKELAMVEEERLRGLDEAEKRAKDEAEKKAKYEVEKRAKDVRPPVAPPRAPVRPPVAPPRAPVRPPVAPPRAPNREVPTSGHP
jgi:hypothetical protein